MAAPEWKPDDRPSARKLNELGDSVNAALDPSLGQNPPPHPPTLIAIFELTEDITYPDSGDMTFPGGWTVPPDVPYAENCKKIWLKNATNTYITSGSDEETVYFPNIRDFVQGEPVARITEDRVEATWNSQSGRWECDISDHGGPFWGTLDGSLTTGSSQTVDIIDNTESTTGDSVTAYDRLLATGETIATGTKVLVQWIRSERRWYVTAAECE